MNPKINFLTRRYETSKSRKDLSFAGGGFNLMSVEVKQGDN
jgi:hypothetical protein